MMMIRRERRVSIEETSRNSFGATERESERKEIDDDRR
jgi:hypothetical protein